MSRSWGRGVRPGRCLLLRHRKGGAQSRREAPGPPQSAGSGWPLRHPSHRCLPREGEMWPSQSSELCPLLPNSPTIPSHRGQHMQDGVNVPPLAWSKPRGRDSSVASASLPRPHPLTPRHLSSHLSAANRMPEAQSARRSGGQDSRKACSSRIMARTLELFTRARLSSRARLAGERRPGRWPRLPGSGSTDLRHLVLYFSLQLLCTSATRHCALCSVPFSLCLPAEGGICFLETFYHSGPMTLYSTVIGLHQPKQ